jgi:RHS repeat-associated protein
LASYIPITDRVGSVVALVTEEGQLVERVKYTTYGKPTFIYDDAPPQVDVVRLESQDSSMFIRFSEPINKEKAETAIKVSKGSVPISGSITFADDNQAAVFTCTTLPVNETLNITITTDLADEFGSQLPGEFSKDFVNTGTDLNIYDRAAPMVTEIRKIGPEFYITFNEEMSSTTTTGAVELTSAQGIFTGDCTADPEDAKTIRFTPGKALSIDVEYTVTVKSNTAADISGKGLSEDFSRSFLNEGKDLFIYEKPNPNEHETSRVNNNCLFQGGIYHPELGLYYFRSRFYSPVLGRFLQPDPMGYQDSFNLYEAFNNNPLNYVDPYGMSSKKHGINPLVSRSAYSKLLKYYRSKGMSGDAASDQALADLVKYGYIEDKSELKLGIAVTAGTGFFYNAMHYVTLPLFELSPAGIFKDAVSLPFGKDLVYGTKLKWWNYAMVAVPILYETFKIGRGLGLADEFLDLGDISKSLLRRGLEYRTASEFIKMGQLTGDEYDALIKISEKFDVKFGLSGGYSETFKSLKNRAKFQGSLPPWRRGPISKLSDIDIWFEKGTSFRDMVRTSREVKSILRKQIDLKYAKYYPTESKLAKRAGGIIFDKGTVRRYLSPWHYFK